LGDDFSEYNAEGEKELWITCSLIQQTFPSKRSNAKRFETAFLNASRPTQSARHFSGVGFQKAAERLPRTAALPKSFPALEITYQDNGLQGIGNVEKRADFGGGNRMISGRIHNYFDKGEDQNRQRGPGGSRRGRNSVVSGFPTGRRLESRAPFPSPAIYQVTKELSS
jgi:hypothetical protein